MNRMRREPKHQLVELDLTPLTDMVTGTVAMLIFTLLLAVLNAGHTKAPWHPAGSSKSPNSGTASPRQSVTSSSGALGSIAVTTNKQSLCFLCWRNRLYFVDAEGFLREFVGQFRRNKAKAANPIVLGRMSGTGEVETNPRTGRYSGIDITIHPLEAGDSSEAVSARASEFGRTLTKLDRNEQWLRFFVSPDSLGVYKAARSYAEGLGFDVGWDPWDGQMPFHIVDMFEKTEGYINFERVQRRTDSGGVTDDTVP